ncbi:IS66 family transposase ISCARN22 [subsurface metagenome]
MDTKVRYQGRVATTEDIEFIRKLIADNPADSRWALSKKLCKAWNWVQPNGALRDMICRGFMLRLDEAGYIKLPPRRSRPNNPLVNRKSPEKIEIDQTPLCGALNEIRPIIFRQVRRTPQEKLFNSLIHQYHYLGYCHPVGEHLKYIAFAKERPITCFAFSSAPRHIGCRDRFIGWRKEIQQKNLHLIAYNTRFLILPWVRVRFLASHLLGRIVRVLPEDWQGIYKHRIYFVETFIDTSERLPFKGTCYRAANWRLCS